ncbi:acetyltransferase [Pedobacter punctiformis]|uniref:Acetyltransferase n=1 Tax=Pedobacter punctiformis TaxID=3004097 RepID=A0ABT4LD80_9SPHI|nr:acetyltransferase [Pedobacter sp. HCMS5-2]MCZ4245863.1 acetyltransferase [Pedobacter sp. HCMS5-2]
MNNLEIYIPLPADYLQIIKVWEASVRATHHFLAEEDILDYKSLIYNEYLHQVDLYCAVDDNQIIAFMGINEDMIQMLFVHPDARSKGVGKKLIEFAIDQKNITKVDVNEQNEQAVGFYERMGFSVSERSAYDASGKPYPVLSMELVKQPFFINF